MSFICSRYHFNVNSEKISEIGHGVTILWLLKVGNLGALRDTGLRSQEDWCQCGCDVMLGREVARDLKRQSMQAFVVSVSSKILPNFPNFRQSYAWKLPVGSI